MSLASTSPVDPDAVLIQALRSDAPGAAEALVDAYGDTVYRLAVRITGSTGDAEEVAQDALWTAARTIHTFSGDTTFESWLYRITAAAAYQRLRSRPGRQREIAWDDVVPPLDGDHFEPMDDWSPRVDEHALQGELRAVLRGAIDELPPDYRTAFVMHDLEGLSSPDIARVLGIGLPAVKSRVHRSRLLLRQRVMEYMSEVAAKPRR